MSATEVTIEYCVPCGLLPAAEKTAHALLSTYGQRLDGVRFTPGHGGVFRVGIGDRTVFDKAAGDGFDVDAIVTRVGDQLPPAPLLSL